MRTAITTVVLGVFVALHAGAAFGGSMDASRSNVNKMGQIFVPCTAPDTTTDGGIPACSGIQTFNEQAGSPATGWLFTAQSKVQLKMKAGPNKVVDPLNPPDSADLSLQLKMKGVNDVGGPALGTGTLALVLRISLVDRVGGPMTLVDQLFNVGIPVFQGKAKVKTSVNALLNSLGSKGLPTAFSAEIVSAQILDSNGNAIQSSENGSMTSY
jgi:hypothetical protein